MNKIRSFREDPSLINKIGVSLVYLVFGWIVAQSGPAGVGGLLSTFMIIGILVWAFVIRQRNVKYFIRYHIVQALLLNITLTAIIWLFVGLLSLMLTLPGLQIIAGYIQNAMFAPMSIGNVLVASAAQILIMSFAIVLAFDCIRGKYTELPWITDGVRHWI